MDAREEFAQLEQEVAALREYVDERLEATAYSGAYQEIQRRDGNAAWHARSWKRVGLTLLGALLVAFGVIISLANKASRVEVVVQTVQLTEDGRLVQIGVPQDVLAYTPAD